MTLKPLLGLIVMVAGLSTFAYEEVHITTGMLLTPAILCGVVTFSGLLLVVLGLRRSAA